MNLLVILPVSRPDLHLALKWIRWAAALRRQPGAPANSMIVVPAASVKPDEVRLLMDECMLTTNFLLFQQPELHEYPELGYGAAANWLFRAALERAEFSAPGRPVLWCEPDCVPTRSTWVQEIADEYATCGKPFLGAFHPNGPIPHMSGNAVYPPNWRQLSPCLAALPGPRPQQGWDSSCAFQVVPQMAVAKTIQQEWITPPFAEHNVDRIVKKETALFHRCKDGTLVDVLAKRLHLAPIPMEAPVCAPTSVMGSHADPGRAPNVAILIVTHAKDIPFLKYCLASIKKYASGFSGVTVVVPAHQISEFQWVKGAIVRAVAEPEGKGMLSHMIQKCRADEWCQDADFVLHMDADCLFFRKVTPGDYVKDFRALSVREAYSGITNPHRHTWRENVRNATGIFPEHDYMVRHPQVHPIAVYRETRDFVEKYTCVPFDDYVLNGRNDFPQSFCEFNTLAAVGNRLFPWQYNYVEYDKAADAALCGQEAGSFQYAYKRDTDFVVEFWGHGGIGRYKSDCEAILAGKIPEYWVK